MTGSAAKHGCVVLHPKSGCCFDKAKHGKIHSLLFGLKLAPSQRLTRAVRSLISTGCRVDLTMLFHSLFLTQRLRWSDYPVIVSCHSVHASRSGTPIFNVPSQQQSTAPSTYDFLWAGVCPSSFMKCKKPARNMAANILCSCHSGGSLSLLMRWHTASDLITQIAAAEAFRTNSQM